MEEDGNIDPEQLHFWAVKPTKALAEALDRSDGLDSSDEFYRLLLVEKINELDDTMSNLVAESRKIQLAAIIARKQAAVD